ncbi:hypothetical protein JCM19037_4594 [Geomicrobium sp. JCM 19037]|uniref:hypothetical protein n=1 Tax=Geomicrobium sp. JCM 19037 TaxID=1460634 RepID=UPI00045F22D5|nr:hypothetical protein [Geomicrobium sp. JCM 19037]GAK06040.1 hypothetical protein JCM19037_4594 [Geomicrobium sp. JCM 19037]
MIKVTGVVLHDHVYYRPGDTIKEITEEQADRLERLDVGQIIEAPSPPETDPEPEPEPPDETDENEETELPDDGDGEEDDPTDEEQIETLSSSFNADELKDAASVSGVGYDKYISKKDLVQKIVDEGKAEEVLQYADA